MLLAILGLVVAVSGLIGSRASHPEPSASNHVAIAIESPAHGSTVGRDFSVRGWAVDLTASGWAGFNSVHVYLDLPAGEGGRLLGAGHFWERPDVAAELGRSDWLVSGFYLEAYSLTPGIHALYVYLFDSRKEERHVGTVSFRVSSASSSEFLDVGWDLDWLRADRHGIKVCNRSISLRVADLHVRTTSGGEVRLEDPVGPGTCQTIPFPSSYSVLLNYTVRWQRE